MPSPNAFIQAGNMTLELQCDRMRFAPAGYEDAQDIELKQGLSIRFMKDGSTQAGAFQAGGGNADIRIVDNYPVEVTFHAATDYDFVLDQIGKNAVLNLAMIDRDVSYGIFDLKGSGAAIKSLHTACGPRAGSAPVRVEAPEGVVYCGGGAIKRQIEYRILEKPADKWDARVTINGETMRAMTACSYFGKSEPPRGFVVSLLGENQRHMARTAEGTVQRLAWSPVRGIRMRRCGGPLRHVTSSGAALRDPFGSHHPDTNRFASEAQDVRAPLKQGIEVQVGSSVGRGRAVQLPRPLRAVNRSGASVTSRTRIRPIHQLSLHVLAVRSWDPAVGHRYKRNISIRSIVPAAISRSIESFVAKT